MAKIRQYTAESSGGDPVKIRRARGSDFGGGAGGDGVGVVECASTGNT